MNAAEAANPQVANPNLIFAGQVLNVPSGSGSQPISQLPVQPAQESEQQSAPSDVPAQQSRPAQSQTVPQQGASGDSGSGPSAVSIPGMPQSLANCIWQRESTSGTNPAANGNQFGIIPASGHDVAGMSLAQQEQVAGQIFAQSGGAAGWAADGCPGT